MTESNGKEPIQIGFCETYKNWLGTIYIDYPSEPLPEVNDWVYLPIEQMDGSNQNLCLEIKRREFHHYPNKGKETVRVLSVTCWVRIVPPQETTQKPDHESGA